MLSLLDVLRANADAIEAQEAAEVEREMVKRQQELRLPDPLMRNVPMLPDPQPSSMPKALGGIGAQGRRYQRSY